MGIFQQILDFLISVDKQLFLFLNGIHSPFFDAVMYTLSQKLVWAPLYAVLLLLMWFVYRKNFWFILPVIILLVTLTDQVSVILFKDVFERLRPCHDPSLEGMVRIVKNHCGGQYGFISSHACNTFGVAVFAGSLLRSKYTWILPALLFWAAIISYSRVYLGVHFPGDVIVGGMVGSIIGYLMVILFRWMVAKRQKI